MEGRRRLYKSRIILYCNIINSYWRIGWILFVESLKDTLRAYHSRINTLEDEKYDMEYIVKRKDAEVLPYYVALSVSQSASLSVSQSGCQSVSQSVSQSVRYSEYTVAYYTYTVIIIRHQTSSSWRQTEETDTCWRDPLCFVATGLH